MLPRDISQLMLITLLITLTKHHLIGVWQLYPFCMRKCRDYPFTPFKRWFVCFDSKQIEKTTRKRSIWKSCHSWAPTRDYHRHMWRHDSSPRSLPSSQNTMRPRGNGTPFSTDRKRINNQSMYMWAKKHSLVKRGAATFLIQKSTPFTPIKWWFAKCPVCSCGDRWKQKCLGWRMLVHVFLLLLWIIMNIYKL